MKPAGNPSETFTLINRIFFLVLFFLVTGCSSPDNYQVTIENRSSQSVDEFLLQVAGQTISLGEIQPAATKRRRLEINQNGTIDYRFKMGEKCYSGQLDEQVSTGQSGNKIIVIDERGEIRIIDEIHHTEIKKPVDNPARQEWALPCMIPG